MLKAGSGVVNLNGGPILGPNGAPSGNLVQQIKMLDFPEFRFEWHPQVQKVLLIEIGKGKGADGCYGGQVIAEHCEDRGKAFGFVQTFLRGYRRGKSGGADIVAPVKA